MMDWSKPLRVMPTSYKPDTIIIGSDNEAQEEGVEKVRVSRKAARPAAKRAFGPNGEVRVATL